MAEVCSFYENEGPVIFPEYKKNKILSSLLKTNITRGDVKQIIGSGKFSDGPLRSALKNVFGERKIGESQNYLCIPSYTITEARPWVFKKDFGELGRDDKAYYVDVALATSAAPTFFPMAEIPYYDNKQFIDGGVWANNPALLGLIEAFRFFVGKDKDFDSIRMLSVSSLSITGGKPTGLKRGRSFVNWKKDLFETSMTGQSYFADYFMQHICQLEAIPIKYFRIPSADISREQEDYIQLDVATPKALQLINGKGNDTADIYEKKPEVIEFFQNKKISKLN